MDVVVVPLTCMRRSVVTPTAGGAEIVFVDRRAWTTNWIVSPVSTSTSTSACGVLDWYVMSASWCTVIVPVVGYVATTLQQFPPGWSMDIIVIVPGGQYPEGRPLTLRM